MYMYVYHLTELTLSALHAVAHLVEALRFKTEVLWFDSQWCHLKFSFT